MNVWHDAALGGLELHHATYITHTFARHTHDYYVIAVVETMEKGNHALSKVQDRAWLDQQVRLQVYILY